MTQPQDPDARALIYSTFGTLRKFRKGEVIYSQNNQADSLFILQSGRIRVERSTTDEAPLLLRVVHSGDMFGELALLNRMYVESAICELNSCVVSYPISLIQGAMDCQSETMKLLTQNMLKIIQFMSNILEIRTIRSPQERVLRYLKLLKSADKKYIHLDRSYKDIAEQIGLTPEALYGALAELEKDGIISRAVSNISTERIPGYEWQLVEYGICLMN